MDGLRIGDVARPLTPLTPDDTLARAAEILRSVPFELVPVAAGGRLVGVVRQQALAEAGLFPCVEYQPGLAFRFGSVVGGHLPTEGFAGFTTLLGGFDTLDAAPTLATLGFNLAHFFLGVVQTAVIAEKCIRHSVGYLRQITGTILSSDYAAAIVLVQW